MAVTRISILCDRWFNTLLIHHICSRTAFISFYCQRHRGKALYQFQWKAKCIIWQKKILKPGLPAGKQNRLLRRKPRHKPFIHCQPPLWTSTNHLPWLQLSPEPNIIMQLLDQTRNWIQEIQNLHCKSHLWDDPLKSYKCEGKIMYIIDTYWDLK